MKHAQTSEERTNNERTQAMKDTERAQEKIKQLISKGWDKQFVEDQVAAWMDDTRGPGVCIRTGDAPIIGEIGPNVTGSRIGHRIFCEKHRLTYVSSVEAMIYAGLSWIGTVDAGYGCRGRLFRITVEDYAGLLAMQRQARAEHAIQSRALAPEPPASITEAPATVEDLEIQPLSECPQCGWFCTCQES